MWPFRGWSITVVNTYRLAITFFYFSLSWILKYHRCTKAEALAFSRDSLWLSEALRWSFSVHRYKVWVVLLFNAGNLFNSTSKGNESVLYCFSTGPQLTESIKQSFRTQWICLILVLNQILQFILIPNPMNLIYSTCKPNNPVYFLF